MFSQTTSSFIIVECCIKEEIDTKKETEGEKKRKRQCGKLNTTREGRTCVDPFPVFVFFF
jgi:hypothetical protein